MSAEIRSDAAIRPTEDQIFLAKRIAEREQSDIGPAMLVNLNKQYGIAKTTSALRLLWGFGSLEKLRTPVAYLQAMLKAMP